MCEIAAAGMFCLAAWCLVARSWTCTLHTLRYLACLRCNLCGVAAAARVPLLIVRPDAALKLNKLRIHSATGGAATPLPALAEQVRPLLEALSIATPPAFQLRVSASQDSGRGLPARSSQDRSSLQSRAIRVTWSMKTAQAVDRQLAQFS